METATLLAENLSWFYPVTNHYQCSDGRYLLITVKVAMDTGTSVEAITGLRIPIAAAHAPRGTDVFLSDADAFILDADEDLANGMTPLAVFEGVKSFEEALAELGYELLT